MTGLNERHTGNDSSWTLHDVIDVKEWQRIQDNFSAVTSVGLRTVDSQGQPFTRASGTPRLCNDYLKKSPFRNEICGQCLPTFLGGLGIVDKNLTYTCKLPRLTNFIAPLRAGERVLGYLIMGPLFLVMRFPKEQYRAVAEQYNLDLDELWSGIVELKVLSFQGAQSLIELIKDIADNMLKLAYQYVRPEDGLRVSQALDVDKLLEALLDVAVQVSGADMGSIMFMEPREGALTIRASKGLSDDVIRNTRVKVGEGISGLAAKERQSFLINEDSRDNRIKSYLNRPFIQSSMVIPIRLENKVMGVMNLGALEHSPIRFEPANLKMMSRLIDLATLALHE